LKQIPLKYNEASTKHKKLVPDNKNKNPTYLTIRYTVIPKVRQTVAKVRQKLSWTDKIILIVGPIDRLTYIPGSILFLASFQTIVKSKYLIIALTVSSA
jgi:hypothetical protein